MNNEELLRACLQCLSAQNGNASAVITKYLRWPSPSNEKKCQRSTKHTHGTLGTASGRGRKGEVEQVGLLRC